MTQMTMSIMMMIRFPSLFSGPLHPPPTPTPPFIQRLTHPHPVSQTHTRSPDVSCVALTLSRASHTFMSLSYTHRHTHIAASSPVTHRLSNH